MNIIVNQKKMDLQEGSRVTDLLSGIGMTKRVAVWVNDQRLLQKEYETRQLQEGDRVKVLQPLGGG